MTLLQPDRPGEFEVHDLLWLKPGVLARAPAWADALPDWALEQLRADTPLIVRRAPPQAGSVPVGIRGVLRSQRHALAVPCAEIAHRSTPYSLRACVARPVRAELPALLAWEALKQRACDVPYRWGPTGSCGYELATGMDWVTPASDLDIVLALPVPITRIEAGALLEVFDNEACRIDVQLITPAGGMALREWAGTSPQVLLKTTHGPVLTAAPWEIQER